MAIRNSYDNLISQTRPLVFDFDKVEKILEFLLKFRRIQKNAGNKTRNSKIAENILMKK